MKCRPAFPILSADKSNLKSRITFFPPGCLSPFNYVCCERSENWPSLISRLHRAFAFARLHSHVCIRSRSDILRRNSRAAGHTNAGRPDGVIALNRRRRHAILYTDYRAVTLTNSANVERND